MADKERYDNDEIQTLHSSGNYAGAFVPLSDKWVPVGNPDNKDWMEIGGKVDSWKPGTSHIALGGYPSWGDAAENNIESNGDTHQYALGIGGFREAGNCVC